MNELQAAVFFSLLTIPLTVALGIAIVNGTVRVVRAIVRLIRRIPAALYAVDCAIERAFRAVVRFIVWKFWLAYYAIAGEIAGELSIAYHAIVHAPRAAFDFVDRCLGRMFPPTLAGFRVEYSTLDYYVRMSSRALTLEQHLRTNGGVS